MKKAIKFLYESIIMRNQEWYIALLFLVVYSMQFFLCVFLLSAVVYYHTWIVLIDIIPTTGIVGFVVYKTSQSFQTAWN